MSYFMSKTFSQQQVDWFLFWIIFKAKFCNFKFYHNKNFCRKSPWEKEGVGKRWRHLGRRGSENPEFMMTWFVNAPIYNSHVKLQTSLAEPLFPAVWAAKSYGRQGICARRVSWDATRPYTLARLRIALRVSGTRARKCAKFLYVLVDGWVELGELGWVNPPQPDPPPTRLQHLPDGLKR